MKPPKYSIVNNAKIGRNARIYDQVNLYGCEIGDNCKIRPFVFIPTGVVIEDNVFIAPNVTFTNDKHPRAHGEWRRLDTRVKQFASIGAGSTINPGVRIGKNALIGSGSVVTKNIPDNAIAIGVPAKVVGFRPPP